MNAPELLPCPFCGDALSPRVMWVDYGYRVVCLPPSPFDGEHEDGEVWPDSGCGAYGARFEDELTSIAAWNRRAPAVLADQPEVKALVAAAVKAERERCAKACDRIAGNTADFGHFTRRSAGMCAAAIRATPAGDGEGV